MRCKSVYPDMIQGPSAQGDSAYRQIECQRAIEQPAMLMLTGSRAPFFDFSSLFHAILPAARAVGWQDLEVKTALEDIVANRRPTSR